MRSIHLLTLPLLLAASAALAQEHETRPVEQPRFRVEAGDLKRYRVRTATPEREPELNAATTRHLVPVPTYATVSGAKVMHYQTQSDYPDYSRYYDGRGVEVVENGTAPRSDYAIGIETGRIQGGGCYPQNPSDPASPCLYETDSSGTQRLVFKEREVWTFRMSYIDPNNPNAVEQEIGFPAGFGGSGDDSLEWVLHTSTNRSCFTFYTYYCDTYGITLNEIEGSVRSFAPNCTYALGKGYIGHIFYQYSRYKDSTSVPPGATEWEPATTAATPTRLAIPGQEIWTRHWALAPSATALRLDGNLFIHPEVEAHTLAGMPASQSTTGSSTHPTIAAGTTDLYVVTEDCGIPFPNTPFILLSKPVPSTNGHIHTGGVQSPPPGAIANVPTFVTGYTGSDGRSQPMHVTAGKFAGTIQVSLHADNVGAPGVSMDSETLFAVGFPWLQQFTMIPEDLDLRTTGGTGLHPIAYNHYGVWELFELTRWAPTVFRLYVDPSAKQLGVNDMSLPLGGFFDLSGNWSSAGHHKSHRIGVDVDFDKYWTDFDGDTHTMSAQDKEDFKNAMLATGMGRVLTEKPIHFRLNEEDIDKYLGGLP